MLPSSPSEKSRGRQMREILAIFVGRVPHRNFMQTRCASKEKQLKVTVLVTF